MSFNIQKTVEYTCRHTSYTATFIMVHLDHTLEHPGLGSYIQVCIAFKGYTYVLCVLLIALLPVCMKCTAQGENRVANIA